MMMPWSITAAGIGLLVIATIFTENPTILMFTGAAVGGFGAAVTFGFVIRDRSYQFLTKQNQEMADQLTKISSVVTNTGDHLNRQDSTTLLAAESLKEANNTLIHNLKGDNSITHMLIGEMKDRLDHVVHERDKLVNVVIESQEEIKRFVNFFKEPVAQIIETQKMIRASLETIITQTKENHG